MTSCTRGFYLCLNEIVKIYFFLFSFPFSQFHRLVDLDAQKNRKGKIDKTKHFSQDETEILRLLDC